MLNIYRLQQLHSSSGGKFFSQNNMRRFGTAVQKPVYLCKDGVSALFITYDRCADLVYDHTGFTIHKFDLKTHKIETVGEFQQYQDVEEAKSICSELHKMG